MARFKFLKLHTRHYSQSKEIEELKRRIEQLEKQNWKWGVDYGINYLPPFWQPLVRCQWCGKYGCTDTHVICQQD